jgi:hypothetical protein
MYQIKKKFGTLIAMKILLFNYFRIMKNNSKENNDEYIEIDNKDYLMSLTPSQRLNYWVVKYYPTRKAFAKEVGLSESLIGKYCRGETIKIPIKTLITMENKAGLNPNFILDGDSSELALGTIKSPKRTPDSIPLVDNIDKRKIKKQTMGECSMAFVERSGLNVHIVDGNEISVVDIVKDGLVNPKVLVFNDKNFCDDYKYKYGVKIVIDNGVIDDGDVVIAKTKRDFFIAYYSRDEKTLIDIRTNKLIEDKDIMIIGKAFTKIEGF